MESIIFIPNVGYMKKRVLEKLILYCKGHSCVIWGAGNTGLRYKRILEYCGIDLKYMVDSDVNKHGIILSRNVQIYSPSYIEEKQDKETIFLLAIQANEGKDIVTKYLKKKNILEEHIYSESLFQDSVGFLGFDIFLGTSQLNTQEVFRVYQNITDSRPIIIAILGSSTTTDKNHGYLCWPKQLFNMMQKEGLSCIVYNGGTEAYISSQSFLKLVRDVLLLSPDIIIEYSGINDACEEFLDVEHPLVCRQLSCRIEKMLNFYNQYRKPYVEKVLYKGIATPPDFGRADIWYTNQRMMYAISQEFNISFISVLEPTIYSGNYKLSLSEKEMIEDDMLIGMKYKERAQCFYSICKKYASKVEYIHDMTGLFDGLSGIMIDDRHCNDKGTFLIAKSIYKILKEKRLL